jgi:hypothetical protein
MAATESGISTTLGSSVASAELAGPGTTLADERLLPVLPALQPLLSGRGLRRGATVTVSRSAALALALVAGASAAGSWVAAVGLPDLGVVAAAETGIALERLALVPTPGARAWPAVVAAFLDAVDVVLVRAPARLPAAQARRLAARARERGAVLVPLGAWPEPADLRLAVTSSVWRGLGQGHGSLHSRQVEILITGRGAATRERRARLWLPSPEGAIAPVGAAGAAAPAGAAASPGAVDNPAPPPPRWATLPFGGPTSRGVALERASRGVALERASRGVGLERASRGPGLERASAGAPAGTAGSRVGPGGPAGLTLAGEGDAPAGEDRSPGPPGPPGRPGRPEPERPRPPEPPESPESPELPLADAG